MRGELYIARNEEIRSWIIEVIKNHRLPFRLWIQPIFPEKSPNQLAYLFGVVCKRIADYTGHTPGEVYHAYKEHFNVEYSEVNGRWLLRYKGASDFSTIDAEDFAMMIRADAVLEMNINIELPNECFISELNFAEYDRIDQETERDRVTIFGKIPKLSYRVRKYWK